MAKVFTLCCDTDDTVAAIADKLMDRHYRDLLDAGVTILYMFVETDGIGAALSHGGYPAAAVCKKNSLQDRVEGKTDVTITIDKAYWDSHDKAQCEALLDHELFHVLIANDDDGKVIVDDIGRPKIVLRKHDFQIGGFFEIAKRHLNDAVEVNAIHEVQKQFVQMKLDFGGAWG